MGACTGKQLISHTIAPAQPSSCSRAVVRALGEILVERS
jgi:hypothetical protein